MSLKCQLFRLIWPFWHCCLSSLSKGVTPRPPRPRPDIMDRWGGQGGRETLEVGVGGEVVDGVDAHSDHCFDSLSSCSWWAASFSLSLSSLSHCVSSWARLSVVRDARRETKSGNGAKECPSTTSVLVKEKFALWGQWGAFKRQITISLRRLSHGKTRIEHKCVIKNTRSFASDWSPALFDAKRLQQT